jgi:glycosyltransferase involved in cell wall biosynthesis
MARKIRYRIPLKIFQRRTSIFIAVSHSIKNYYIDKVSIPSKKIRVIYNFIDLTRFSKRLNRKEIRKSLGIREDEFVIGFVGRLIKPKGCEYLIESVKRLQNIKRSLVLLMIGDGILYQTLMKMSSNLGVNKRAIFLGNRKDINRLLSIVDIGVIPSLSEPFGIVTLEFMAMKIPVIASRVGGLSELIEHERNGLLVEKGSIEDLTITMTRLINDDTLRKKLSTNAYKFIKDFDKVKIGEDIKDLYSQLLKN